MPVVAKLDADGIADVLRVVGGWGHSGQFSFQVDEDEVDFFLSCGNLVVVTSSNQSLRLGQTLRRLGALSVEQLHQALRDQSRTDAAVPLGTLLVTRGVLSREDLARTIQEQAIAALSLVIASGHGTLIYRRDIEPPPGIVVVPVRTDQIFVEAARRVDELNFLRTRLPAPTAPLALDGQIHTIANELTDAEVLVALTLSDRAASVVDLSRKTVLETSELARAVAGLRRRGLLVVHPESDPPPVVDARPASERPVARPTVLEPLASATAVSAQSRKSRPPAAATGPVAVPREPGSGKRFARPLRLLPSPAAGT